MKQKIRKEETSLALMLMLFTILLSISLFLNFLISMDFSINDIKDFKLTKLQTKEIENTKEINYTWLYNVRKNNQQILLYKNEYEFYKNLSRSNARDYSYYVNYHSFMQNDAKNKLDILTTNLINTAQKREYSRIEMAEFLLSFVQNFPNEKDADDYPKFPYETLYEMGGDCEDLAILASFLLESAGFQTVIIEFNNHVGLGVSTESTGAYYLLNGIRYYYAEPTATGLGIGELPVEFEQEGIIIYSNKPSAYIDFDWKIWDKIINHNEKTYEINLSAQNIALKPANINLSIYIEYESPYEKDVLAVEDNFFLDGKSEVEINYITTALLKKNRLHLIATSKEINNIHLKSHWMN